MLFTVVLSFFLERKTNHLKIPKVLLQNFLETDERFFVGFFPELSMPCQKELVEASTRFQKS